MKKPAAGVSRNSVVIVALILFAAVLVTQLQSANFTNDIAAVDRAASSIRATQDAVAKVAPPKTQATRCQRTLPAHLHKAQSEEDKMLLKWFKNFCGGTYIEMGGLDGVEFSNSHVFNKGLGWKGVLVEADPRSYKQLVINRPNEIATVHAGVCLDEKDLHYVLSGGHAAVSGFLEFATKEFKNMHWTQQVIDKALIVKCRRLDKILQETVGKSFYFDFFSLDIEGAELLALQSLNFDEYQFGIIVVEADGKSKLKDDSIKALLGRSGYDFIHNINRSNWFINKNFDLIYQDVVYENP
eukprot:CAMPEP_0198118224 /NCGR_PEP_ID=MMETSP1442-20131203/20804_1 /TAXON_ID= /ORGANISM="Craspedostauros australis, Strain CCMP3328" /LENGTH=297 /DNA_ID=CAMNT_0043776445 /DNA_START=157 /DNA_END=1050 /DNA_ORIENTATION=-